jgi:hypothetical protein
VVFLILKTDLRATIPPPSHNNHFPKTSNQNFEVAILFSVVKRTGNYVFEDDTPTITALRARVVSYALGAYKVFL